MFRFLVELLLLQFLLPALVLADTLQLVGLTKDGLFRDLGPILSDSAGVNMLSICPRESYRAGFTVLCRMQGASYVHFRVNERWVRKEVVSPFYISGNCGKVGNSHTNRIIYPWESHPWGIVRVGCYGDNGAVINGTVDISCGDNDKEDEVVIALPEETPLQAIPPGTTVVPEKYPSVTPTPKYVNNHNDHKNHDRKDASAANDGPNAEAVGAIIVADITVPDSPVPLTHTHKETPAAQSGGVADIDVTAGKESADAKVSDNDDDVGKEVEAIPPGGKVTEEGKKKGVAGIGGIDILSIFIPISSESSATPEIAAGKCVKKKATDYSGGKPAEWAISGTDSGALTFRAAVSIGQYDARYALTYEFSVRVRSTYALIPDVTGHGGVGWISCSMGLELHNGTDTAPIDTTIVYKPVMMMRRHHGNSNNTVSTALATAAALEPGMNYACKIAGGTNGTTLHGLRMFPCEGVDCRADSEVWQKYSDVCKM